jgi:hypothetical protein
MAAFVKFSDTSIASSLAQKLSWHKKQITPVRKVINRIGGHLQAESFLATGATFYLELTE